MRDYVLLCAVSSLSACVLWVTSALVGGVVCGVSVSLPALGDYAQVGLVWGFAFINALIVIVQGKL